MAPKAEIWYRDGSPLARLAKPLARQYRLCALSSSSVSKPVRRSARKSTPRSTNGRSKAVFLADLGCEDHDSIAELTRQLGVRVIGILPQSKRPKASFANGGRWEELYACLPWNAPVEVLHQTIEAVLANLELAERERRAREELARAERDMEELNRIGVALSAQHDLDLLFAMIVEKARAITSADAGSLYLVEETPEGQRRLRFKVTQNDSCEFSFQEFAMPLSETSMAGYVALHGEAVQLEDAYQIAQEPSAGRPYRFNPEFDQRTGYRTRSMLTLPMKNAKGEVLGVLQLINCKRDPAARLTSREVVEREVLPFTERAVRLAHSLASQAAVAYENSRLYEDIESLFEGFVHASVTAIEQRDPTTSGHSNRVATMTVGLAEVVDRVDTGPYAQVRFTREQMKEIRYAALLHDFGKVAVREEVLVKAKKLYPSQLNLLESRFDYVRKEAEAHNYRRKLELFEAHAGRAPRAELERIEAEYRQKLEALDDYFRVVRTANEPTVLPAGDFDRLLEIAGETYRDPRGGEHPLLTPDEVRCLSIPQGSLDEGERKLIESHVVHSFNFLMRIPWTREIRGIPWIARAHHEKLNGKGYPYRLTADEIPVQAKIMTICDIYDALYAADRPYKKAVPAERALEILEMSVRDNELDPSLFQMFVAARVFQLIQKRCSDDSLV
jgi:HD-GYP domain-containing protein (c-di-GMP phosphodiesterase class II)